MEFKPKVCYAKTYSKIINGKTFYFIPKKNIIHPKKEITVSFD